MNKFKFALVISAALLIAGCTVRDDKPVLRSVARVPQPIPNELLRCERPLPTTGITTERQLARRTTRNEGRHWQCYNSIQGIQRFNEGVKKRAQEQLRALGEVY